MRGEVLQLAQPLNAGVAGAHKYKPEVLAAARWVFERLGDVQALQHLVAQGGGVGERLQADPALGQAGDRQAARHRAQRDQELIVGELEP